MRKLLLFAATLSCLPCQAQLVPLVPDPPAPSAWFGSAVAVSADGRTALVGAFSEDHGAPPPNYNFGAAYVFVRDSDGWRQQARLVAADARSGAYFGISVALSADGETALIGARGDDEVEPGAGAAYVFRRLGDEWVQEAKLLSPEPGAYRRFGNAVALSGNGLEALVGAGKANPNGSNGSAVLFEYVDGQWRFETRLIGDPDARFLGGALALSADGSIALVGISPFACAGGCPPDPYPSFIFRRSTTGWNSEARIEPTGAEEAFGISVALSDDGSLALLSDPVWSAQRGRVHVFEYVNGRWEEVARLDRPDTEPGFFGSGVALNENGTQAAIGATGLYQPGNLYVFNRMFSGWMLDQVITDPNGGTGNYFGAEIALSYNGGVLLIGESGEDEAYPSHGVTYVAELLPVETDPLPAPPARLALSVWPHPIVSTSTIEVMLLRPQHVRLTLYDLLGRQVNTIYEGPLQAGAKTIPIEARSLPAGMY
ncbi:MAG: FG-GAP repeat protein, partial [Bacteroidetes bacterium]|nr:FG-GAP repeat protein [Bacteroidota bacterium]